MSGHDNEELIDYEEDQEVLTNGASVAVANGGAASGLAEVDGGEKKNFSGIHSTGFRYFKELDWNKLVSYSCSFQRFSFET